MLNSSCALPEKRAYAREHYSCKIEKNAAKQTVLHEKLLNSVIKLNASLRHAKKMYTSTLFPEKEITVT